MPVCLYFCVFVFDCLVIVAQPDIQGLGGKAIYTWKRTVIVYSQYRRENQVPSIQVLLFTVYGVGHKTGKGRDDVYAN